MENEGKRLIQEQITVNNYQSHKVLKGFSFLFVFLLESDWLKNKLNVPDVAGFPVTLLPAVLQDSGPEILKEESGWDSDS